MKLERARELYSDYNEGTLSPAMRLAFEQHLDADAAARTDYEEFTRIYSTLDAQSEDTVEVPMGFRAKVLEMAEAEMRRGVRLSPLDQLGAWLRIGPQRRTTSGLAVALGVAVVAAVAALAVVEHNASRVGTANLTFFPTGGHRAVSGPTTTILGATTKQGDDGFLYHLFRVHLPEGAPASTVNAYLVTDVNQITNPDDREANATVVLKHPQRLENDEEMQIPVAVQSGAETASVLTLLVDWQTVDPTASSGAQVVFTPLEASESPATSSSVTSDNQSFFSALEAIAAHYHITVVADADRAPTAAVSFSPMEMEAPAALHAVADPLGYDVRALDDHTYQVYAKN
jgi:hypothetical protein